MSESYGIGMASAASADDADGDAGDVDQEGRGGGGPAEDDNRNGIDGDHHHHHQQQQEEHDGGMAIEEGGSHAGAGGESDGIMQEAGDGEGDDMDEADIYASDANRDISDDGYEEDGVSVEVVAGTPAAVPEGCLRATDIEARFPYNTTDATKELTRCIIGRTITSQQQAADLIEQGADLRSCGRRATRCLASPTRC
ncbi:unnamed protein product [Vitrella brassicaformis CCMP3155]|uniref:Uncharacterized protein n=1 Tax=Vitrella brassicaformis (strain CCMP3155) TaxID=1169540 RepID=A0A0G4G275_VITBC|nr:unnamed protein product [Vitrella brassicaformis CCMP3155]|eukprot:CEM22085.1 unnamed protein product [Vitrella brassicaformis CCMP3155]